MDAGISSGPNGWRLLDRAIFRLTGADRVRFLHGQCTQDIKRMPGQEARYACATTAKGRLSGDFFVRATDDALWIDAHPDLRETLAARLDRYIIADDVVLEDVSDDFRILHLVGDAAAPADAIVHQCNRIGLAGVDWLVPFANVPTPQNLPAWSAEDWEQLRIAHGIAEWGRELHEDTLPPEAGIEARGISYDKGCYTGQEVISRIKSIGHVNRKLVGLTGDVAPAIGGEFSTLEGAPAITVTSWSGEIGLGYLARRAGDPTEVRDADGRTLRICPFPLPFSLRN